MMDETLRVEEGLEWGPGGVGAPGGAVQPLAAEVRPARHRSPRHSIHINPRVLS